MQLSSLFPKSFLKSHAPYCEVLCIQLSYIQILFCSYNLKLTKPNKILEQNMLQVILISPSHDVKKCRYFLFKKWKSKSNINKLRSYTQWDKSKSLSAWSKHKLYKERIDCEIIKTLKQPLSNANLRVGILLHI